MAMGVIVASFGPVAVAVQTGYLTNGAAFEYSISTHRYDEFSLEIVLTHR